MLGNKHTTTNGQLNISFLRGKSVAQQQQKILTCVFFVRHNFKAEDNTKFSFFIIEKLDGGKSGNYMRENRLAGKIAVV